MTTHVALPGRTCRHGRRALVAADLGRLSGPTAGVVSLPHRLVWAPAPANVFDLADDFDRRHLYEIVLREAVQHVELETWLDAELLVELWPRLYLPRGIRQAWQETHPHLRPVPVV